MQRASLYAVALVAGSLIAACASSDPAPEETTQEAPATQPAPQAPATKPPPPPECTSVKCSADTDCAAACTAKGAIGCCDTATHQCFKSAAAECPKPTPDAGEPPPAY